jgi:hypothetical protein
VPDAPLEVLDRCRIRWGRVTEIEGDSVVVSSRHLRFDGSRLELGVESSEVARNASGGSTMVRNLEAGDFVSLHWDWICERLSGPRLRWLQYCTARNLEAVNCLPTPPPAAVCEI